MNAEYLLLPRLEIQAANAQAAWWLINTAPVMAANLFAHNLGLKTGKKIPCRVGLLHHDAQLLGERFYGKFQPQQRRGAVFIDGDDYSSKNKHALSLQPTASCHLTLSLLLAYDDGLPKLTAVADFLHGARLAGGQIVRHGKLETFDSAASVRRRLRGGYWIVERMDLLETAQGEGDALDAMIRACTYRSQERSHAPHGNAASEALRPETPLAQSQTIPVDADATTQSVAGCIPTQSRRVAVLPRLLESLGTIDLPQSWVVPTTLGYAALTDFARRAGVREGFAHAYAEPLVGLVQYVSLRDWSERPLPLWHGHWPREDVFVVTQGEISHD